MKRHFSRVRIVYRVPDPLDTLEAWARYGHRDLVQMSRAELEAERAQLTVLLLMSDRPSWWHKRRLQRVQEALRDARS
jgi:hypothetical protein